MGPQVQETFHNQPRQFLRHTDSVHVKDNMQCMACNNFAFTFQLMTVGALNTAGLQISKQRDFWNI